MEQFFFNLQPANLTAEKKEQIRKKLEAKMFATKLKQEERIIVIQNRPEKNPWFITSFL